MPTQQEVRWSQLKVGVVVLVAAVILVTLLFLITSSSGLGVFSKKLTITTYFENSAGLKEGGAVTLEGVTVGSIKSVSVSHEASRKLTPVRVVMKIDSKYDYDLKTDSKAALKTNGVLGDTLVDINSQTAVGPALQDGDELKTLETPDIAGVLKASQGTIEQLNVILAKANDIVDNLQSGKGSVGKLINDPDLYNKLDSTVTELNKIEVGLNAGEGTVGKLLKDDQMYDRLNLTAGKLDQIATSLQAGKGTAGKLLTDDTLYTNLNQTLMRTNALLADVQNGKGTAGMLISDPKVAQSIKDTLDQTNQIIAKVNKGEGTLGKLTTDDQAYANLNKLLTESTLLVTTIRQDPKKYLTIHLKIF